MLYNVLVMKLSDYMTIKEASEFIGVCEMTLRRWDAAGKLNSKRHPANRYRLYKKSDLEKFLRKVK